MDLHRYSELYKRSIVSYDNLIKLFDKNELNKDKIYGFNKGFIDVLIDSGFKDLKTLMKFREDFKKLAEIFDK